MACLPAVTPQTADEALEIASERAEARYRIYRERIKNSLKLAPPARPQKEARVDAGQAEKIKSLIRALAKIERPDYGFSATMSGHAFLPVEGQHESGAFLITNHGLEAFPALKELVSLGPEALPLLLDSLEDQTPTKMTLEHRAVTGSMWFDQEMDANPLNRIEAETTGNGENFGPLGRFEKETAQEYTVKIGDICFVAIGQIVGRSYQAVRYQPSGCTVVNSPTHDPDLAAKVRKIWSTQTPRQFLLRSLLRDYSSIGIYRRTDPLWDVCSRLQCNAALRLLYYYPTETADLIAERLKGLDVRETPTDTFLAREVENSVRTEPFIRAVSWSRHPAIREAVTELFLKTTDDQILLAALPGIADPERIPGRIRPLLEKLPPDEGPIYGLGWKILLAWTQASPETAQQAMQEYIKNGEIQRLQSACAVLSATSPDWKAQFMRPLLDDRRDLKSWSTSETRRVNGREVKIRLCDMAASILAEQDRTLAFKLGGSVEDVDRQIASMRQKLDEPQD
ncbi:MAG TPA: hypothetical protein VG125_30365 [Pirellulales bacterium]|nr:hypothetical protein [Pirellulales bacterium]